MQRTLSVIAELDQSIAARQSLVQSSLIESSSDEEEEPVELDESTESSHVCHECPDCRMGTPIHLKTKQLILDSSFDLMVKSCSKTSLTDSAISSMSSCLTKDYSRCLPKETNL